MRYDIHFPGSILGGQKGGGDGRENTYRQHRWGRVLVPVLAFPLGRRSLGRRRRLRAWRLGLVFRTGIHVGRAEVWHIRQVVLGTRRRKGSARQAKTGKTPRGLFRSYRRVHGAHGVGRAGVEVLLSLAVQVRKRRVGRRGYFGVFAHFCLLVS